MNIIPVLSAKVKAVLPQKVKETVDQGLLYAKVAPEDLKLIRNLMVSVGVKSSKQLFSMNPPKPSNNLEEFLYLKASQMKSPSDLTKFISKVSVAQTQEELAIALEVPPEKVHTLIPDREFKDIAKASLKLFSAKTLVTILNNIMYYGFFQNLAFVKMLLGEIIDVGGFIGDLIQKIIFSIKNTIVYTFMTFIPMGVRLIGSKVVDPILGLLTKLTTSAILLGKSAKDEGISLAKNIAEQTAVELPNLVKTNKIGSVIPDKEKISDGFLSGIVTAIQTKAKQISNYFTKYEISTLQRMAGEAGLVSLNHFIDAEQTPPSNKLEKRIYNIISTLEPKDQIEFVTSLYEAQSEEEIAKILNIAPEFIPYFFPNRRDRNIKIAKVVSIAFLVGIALAAMTALLGGVSALTAALTSLTAPLVSHLGAFTGGVAVGVFLKTMIAKGVLSGVIGTSIKMFLFQGPRQVKYLVMHLKEWVVGEIKQIWSKFMGFFKKKTARRITFGEMLFETFSYM